MQPDQVGKKLKQIYPNDIANDGRPYSQIPDAEIGTMFLLKHGDKGLTALGMSKEENATQVQTKVKAQTSAKDLDLFEKNLQESELRGKILGKFVPANLGFSPNSADFDAQKSALAYTLAGVIAGQEGRGISDTDVRKFEKLLPGRGNTDQEAKQKMDNIRQMITFRTGEDKKQSMPTIQKQPEETRTETIAKFVDPQKNPVSKFLLGTAMNTAQDIGTGIRSKMEQGNLDKMSKVASEIEARAVKEKDPAMKKKLLQEANNIRMSVSTEAGDISKSFSEDVNVNPLVRAPIAATEIVGTAELPAIVSGVKKLVTEGAKNISKQLPTIGVKNKAANREMVAKATEATFSGDNILKTAEEYSLKDPTVMNIFQKIEPTLRGQKLDAVDLLDRIRIWGQAYKDAGGLKETSKANLYDRLSKAARKEMEIVSPELSKAHKEFAKAMGTNAAVKDFTRRATYGLPAAAATTLLGYFILDALNKKE